MLTAAALGATLFAAAGTAAPDRNQLYFGVRHQLTFFVPGVDIETLSNAQIREIFLILHSGRGESDKALAIRSAIGGSHTSLRGLLFGR